MSNLKEFLCKVCFYFCSLVFCCSGIQASAYVSSRLTNYEISQCRANNKCFRVKGVLAFLSQKLDAMSASDATLEVYETQNFHHQSFNCSSLNFNFNSQFLICDNSDVRNSISIALDSELRITRVFNK